MPEDTPNIRIVTDTAQGAVAERPRSWWRRGVGLLIGLLLLAGIGYVVWFWPAAEPATRARPARVDAIPVLIATAERKDVPIWLDGLGTVQASATVTVKPMVDGQLVEVRFQEGQDIQQGDILARIDPRGYQAALDQALAKKAQDEALLANARVDEARYAQLVQNKYASAQQADTARAQVAQLQAQVAQDQALIDTARTNLSYTTIAAPITGRAGMRLLDQGNITHASDPAGLVMLTTLQPIAVIFTLPQQNLPAIAGAMRAGQAEVIALAQSGAQSGAATTTTRELAMRELAMRELDRGKLAVLDNQVDPTTGTLKLKALFPNAERLLWPGGFVNVRLRVDTRVGALVVPPAAIQRGPRGSFVYVVTEESTVRRRPVTVGYEDQATSVVTTGLQPGERVVVDGAARLNEDTKVTIASPDTPNAAPPQAAPPGARRRGNRGT